MIDQMRILCAQITACGVHLERPEGDHPHARMDDTGYTICLPAWCNSVTVLQHEFNHVLRGDCIAIRTPDLDVRRANVAMDAVINRHLSGPMLDDVENLMSSHYNRSFKCVRIQDFPDVPQNPTGWQQVYDALPKDMPDGPDDVKNTAKDMEKAATHHAATVMKAMQAGYLPVFPSVDIPFSTPDPRLLRLTTICDRIQHLSDCGLRVRIRSRRRPGRTPWLRGIIHAPRLHVALAVDISGSMQAHWGESLSAARMLARQHDLTVITYSDHVISKSRTIPSSLIGAGGGTLFTPVAELTNTINPDALVVYTDAEHEISPMLPACPVLWVLVGTMCPKLRPQDRRIGGDNAS